MVFKVQEEHITDEGTATFSFNVLSEMTGIKLWLTDYRLKKGNKVIKKWAHFGNNGSFINRSKIIIPESVIESAKAKIVSAIFLEADK